MISTREKKVDHRKKKGGRGEQKEFCCLVNQDVGGPRTTRCRKAKTWGGKRRTRIPVTHREKYPRERSGQSKVAHRFSGLVLRT